MKITLKELSCLSTTFKDLFPGAIVLFTGTNILNVLGALDADCKDIDVLLIPNHPDVTISTLQEWIKKEFPEESDVEKSSEDNFFSVSAKYFGHTVEIQVREASEDYLTLFYEGNHINFSKIDEMFKWKLQFNEYKAKEHIIKIADHLINQKGYSTTVAGTMSKMHIDDIPF